MSNEQILKILNDADYKEVYMNLSPLFSEAKYFKTETIKEDLQPKEETIENPYIMVLPEDSLDKIQKTYSKINDYERIIASLREEVDNIQKSNEYLYKENDMLRNQLDQIPWIMKKIFVKDTTYLLADK